LFAFQYEKTQWEFFDWSLVTTLAVFGRFDPQMVCTAHANNARVVFGTGLSVTQLRNLSATSEWIISNYQRLVDTFADGINIDIEDPLQQEDAYLLTELVQNVSSYIHAKLPYSQVTFDVAWSPNCIDQRCYDYAAIARATDFVIIMDYDMRSQIFGPCIASANSPPNLLQQGVANFTKLGIPTSKLVMGVPWYGYDYPCKSVNGQICDIPPITWRGVNCSDAAGTERAYSAIKELLANSTTGYQWDPVLQSPWFNYMSGSSVHQVWFDDARSLLVKTALAKQLQLRGVSMWTGDFVDYIGDPQSAESFWDAMRFFFH